MPMQATTTTPLFSAALKPDRSPRIMGGWVGLAVATVLAAPLAVLVADMALPIAAAFVGGTAAMSWMTLQQSRRRKQTQQITLWPDELEVITKDGKGERVLQRFAPKAVRLVLQRDEHEKTVALTLRIGKIDIEVGAFLSPQDKSSFAKAFGTALRKARRDA